MIRRVVLAGALVFGLVALASPASATPFQKVYTPNGQSGIIYAESPSAGRICASATSSGATASVTAYSASGAFVGQVIDAANNGVSICRTLGAVNKVVGIIEKQGKPGCFRRYTSYKSGSFAAWSLSVTGLAC